MGETSVTSQKGVYTVIQCGSFISLIYVKKLFSLYTV